MRVCDDLKKGVRLDPAEIPKRKLRMGRWAQMQERGTHPDTTPNPDLKVIFVIYSTISPRGYIDLTLYIHFQLLLSFRLPSPQCHDDQPSNLIF